jgi:hypothetical protein
MLYRAVFVLLLFPQFASAGAICSVAGQMRYNSGDYQYCNGSWQTMTVSTTATGCSTPGQLQKSGSNAFFCNGSVLVQVDSATTDGACTTAGAFVYRNSKMEFCNGTNFVVTGAAAACASVPLTISSDTSDYNVFTAAGSPSSCVAVTLTINSGITVSASSTATAALRVPAFPAGSTVTIVNNGRIQGKGGAGGVGGNQASISSPLNGTGGSAGGPALDLSNPVSIDNTSGVIAGGGGGGGGGGN